MSLFFADNSAGGLRNSQGGTTQPRVSSASAKSSSASVFQASYSSEFNVRQQLVSEDLPIVCYECPVKFDSIRELTAHMMMHAVLKPFSCGRCLQPFAEADKTKQHFYNSCRLLYTKELY